MLILASSSPRRRQLLAFGGWPFSILPVQVDERVRIGEHPDAYVRRLAAAKAQAAARLQKKSATAEILIVSADTAVVHSVGEREMAAGCKNNGTEYARSNGETGLRLEILGKPTDSAEAEKMLRRLRGRIHQVFTGLAVLRAGDGDLISDVCITDVPMRHYSDDEMKTYITSGDPLDKAGAYAIQNPGFKPVEALQGCYANVVGLPVCHLARMLSEFDLSARQDVPGNCQEILGFDCHVYTRVLENEQSR